ncbi:MULTISPECIES: hypothetical protein [Pseudoalteromonas]|jgi:PBP1b-binding outer membrane lipoprotein LpoB|uniref:Orphan protein signal peptide n=1 Tax=Pseudoalteromonas sp. SD03 TaxID=3231719 RepID=A0AB39APN0_9GAMM|nr:MULTISPECIES: hypothetical protein [Pseudoalteromonas]MAY57788.1 hypothetical protein [Pseudoalteromonas sp.]MDN3393862.1 hypothetical protein [Pseudoalteromonas sp. APC 3215]MDN3402152.1 hypothetical protein [Pseudoalteromonas sp. APC 3213]MDN3405402.1 hypothetical protein [Pseudoalteromonas sp. APC 3218]MDN3410409.1 hypothetical protein [Pseudoalteromonas sp. APC 3894]|tara:strand:- start:1370 stop:1750 length:381 start_codon:yes stop_codon:yes gene_type:complete
MKILLAITAISLFLSGCLAQSSEPTPKLQHALLIEPNSAKVADAIAQLLHSSQVQLADDVFVTSSTVTLEQLNHKDPQGNPIMGKQLNMPDQFELVTKGEHCFVRHLDSKATIELKQVLCKINPQR